MASISGWPEFIVKNTLQRKGQTRQHGECIQANPVNRHDFFTNYRTGLRKSGWSLEVERRQISYQYPNQFYPQSHRSI